MNILILGASYGSLLAAKILLAGHSVTLVCRTDNAERINKHGIQVRLPVRGRKDLVELDSRKMSGKLLAAAPREIKPPDYDLPDYDLIVLAMQEPQLAATGVRELLDEVGRIHAPCLSIMNMPPLPFLNRIPGLELSELRKCYTDPRVWTNVDPSAITSCSPDPQAFIPSQAAANVIEVGLATNFKAARFTKEADTAILRKLQSDIEAIRFDTGDDEIELPVKLKVHDSIYVALAKWPMLMTGNYRCVMNGGMQSICAAVHGDKDASQEVYEWTSTVCRAIGMPASDLVPFEKYARAAACLEKPSSIARALKAGATDIERVDLLVRSVACQKGLRSAAIDVIVERIDTWLKNNKARA